MTIQARPTLYRGIQMRSRLEARVAAWLDAAMDVSWRYEPCAFANRRGQYLPDFMVEADGRRIYIEVRATAERAAEALEQMPVILESDPTAILSIIVPPIGLRISCSSLTPWTQSPWSW